MRIAITISLILASSIAANFAEGKSSFMRSVRDITVAGDNSNPQRPGITVAGDNSNPQRPGITVAGDNSNPQRPGIMVARDNSNQHRPLITTVA
jgi:hypothetical protein